MRKYLVLFVGLAHRPVASAVRPDSLPEDLMRLRDFLLAAFVFAVATTAHALAHWDPARDSGHGTHRDYDTHVPLIFLGPGFVRGNSGDRVTPYDLAPTLGAAVGITLPHPTGRSLLSGLR